MNESEICALIDRQLANAMTTQTSVEDDQADAQDYYHGRPMGNEVAGRSRIVTRDVLETIEWIKPSLLRIFGPGQKVCVFDPTGPEDELAAEQDTDVVNQILVKDNDWFLTVYEWIHDALLQKNGYIKIYAEEKEEVETVTHYGLTDQQLVQVLEQAEPVEHNESVEQTELGDVVLHDIKARLRKKAWKICIDTVPQDEIRIPYSYSSVNLDDVAFIAHEREMPASDLIEMGHDKGLVDQLGLDRSDESQLKYARGHYETRFEDEETDPSMRLVTVQECYIKLDLDGDGVAELHRVLKSGSTILEIDEWDYIPFVAMSAIPLPHEHMGMSEADLVMDLQEIRTALLRQILDNLYLTNNPEKEAVIGKVNMDDLLVSVPGGVKRVKEPNSIKPLTVPFTAGASLPMLDVIDGMKESRTGVSRHTQGLDANVLAQSTKGAFMGALKQANQRVEMIARIFAETGFKALFRKAHGLIRKYQDVPRTIRIRNTWVDVNPAQWRERNDVTVVVGTGNVNDDEMLAKLLQLADRQEQHLLNGSPMVSLKNLYNTYEQIVQKSGLKDVSRYFTDPAMAMPPAPPPPGPSESDKFLMLQQQVEELKASLRARELDLKEREQNRKEAETAFDMKHRAARFEADNAVDLANAGVTGLAYPQARYE